MAIQIQGNGGVVAEVDGTTFRAARTTPKPMEHGAFGHYRVSARVALVVTQAANGNLFTFRWGDATRFMVLTKFRMAVAQTAAATATIVPAYQVFVARSYSANAAAGTALTLTTNSMKKRTNMGTTLMSDMRKSAVAAGVTNGTRTLDADPILEMNYVHQITTINPAVVERQLDIDVTDGNHPYVFAQNEGLEVRGPTIVFGAAGTADLIVDMSWAEVAAY